MAVIEHTELAPDQHPDADRVPTRGLQAHHLRPSLDQLYQAFLLPGGQFRSAPAAMAGDQAVHATQQQGLLPAIDTGWAETPALTQHRHGHVVHKEVDQYRSPPHQAHIIALIGALQTALEIFDGCVTELYPDAHGCILRWGYWQVFFERYTRVLMEASPEFPIHFLKIYSSDRCPVHAPGDSVCLPGPDKLPGERLEYSLVDTQRLLCLVLPRHLHMRDYRPVTALKRGHRHHEPSRASRGGMRISQPKSPVSAIQERLDTVQRLLGKDIRRGSRTPADLQVVRPDSEHGGYPLGVTKAPPDLIDDQNGAFLIQHRNASLQGTQDDAGERFRSPFDHKVIACLRWLQRLFRRGASYSHGGLGQELFQQPVIVKAQAERFLSHHGQHAEEVLLVQDGYGKTAVEAAHPPPVEPQHVGSGKAIRDVEGLTMLCHPSEAPVPIAKRSTRDTLPNLDIRTALDGQCARAFICHPDRDIRDTQRRRRGVADGREDLWQLERCRELPREMDESFQDECWLNPLT